MFDFYASVYAAKVKDQERHTYTLVVYFLLVAGSKTQNTSATTSLDATTLKPAQTQTTWVEDICTRHLLAAKIFAW